MTIEQPNYTIWKEGKHFVVQSNQVDVSSFGLTKKEVTENLKEALELFFEKEPRLRK